MRDARRIAAIAGVIGGLLWFASLLRSPAWLHPVHAEILTLGVVLSVVGIVGGILALVRPAVGRILMLASAVGGFSVPFALFWQESIWQGVGWIIRPFPAFPVLIVGVSGALLLVTWKKPSRARIAALVLGIVAALMSAGAAQITIGRIGEGPAALSPFFSFIGIVGGILALARPRIAWMLMVVAGIGCFLAAVVFFFAVFFAYGEIVPLLAYILAGLLFITAGGMLALASSRERPAAIYTAMLLGVIGGLFATLCALAIRFPLLFLTPWLMLQREGLLLAWNIQYWIWVALFPVMGFVAGVFVLARPRVAGALMFISALSGYIGFLGLAEPFGIPPVYCVPGCLLLFLGGAFALVSAKKQPKGGVSHLNDG